MVSETRKSIEKILDQDFLSCVYYLFIVVFYYGVLNIFKKKYLIKIGIYAHFDLEYQSFIHRKILLSKLNY